jgi:hypothetical protein
LLDTFDRSRDAQAAVVPDLLSSINHHQVVCLDGEAADHTHNLASDFDHRFPFALEGEIQLLDQIRIAGYGSGAAGRGLV